MNNCQANGSISNKRDHMQQAALFVFVKLQIKDIFIY